MHVLAPAKINLHLRVGPRRADGFHPLLTWMCTVGLFDRLTFEPTSPAAPRELALRCDRPDLPRGAENLVCRSAAALAAVCPNSPGVDACLQKSIPSGAGLGGGSSDAARTLLALNQMWSAGLGIDELAKLAASVGSDVPFFLNEPSAMCELRGEQVRKIPVPRARAAILVLPKIHCATAEVYRQFDRMGLGEEAAVRQMLAVEQWINLPARELLERLVNDLEAAAFSLWPELGEIRCRAEQILGRPVRMSGSGSSLFSLFDELPQAANACECLKKDMSIEVLPVPLCPRLLDDLAV